MRYIILIITLSCQPSFGADTQEPSEDRINDKISAFKQAMEDRKAKAATPIIPQSSQ